MTSYNELNLGCLSFNEGFVGKFQVGGGSLRGESGGGRYIILAGKFLMGSSSLFAIIIRIRVTTTPPLPFNEHPCHPLLTPHFNDAKHFPAFNQINPISKPLQQPLSSTLT